MRRDDKGRYSQHVAVDGFRSIRPEDVAPGYKRPGFMSDACRGGINGSGEAQQSGRDPYYDTAEEIEK